MAKTTHKNLLRTVEELRWDVWLAATAIGLTLFGVIMVYSASAGARNPSEFLYGQIRWAALGLIVMLIVRRVDYHKLGQPSFVYGFLGVCALLLLLVFLFPKVNNASRWIHFKGFSAQPSELAKIALVIFLAWFLSERERDGELNSFWATVAPASVVVGLLSVLILREPDLGATLMLGVIFLTMLFAAGASMWRLYQLMLILLAALVYLVVKVVWRWDRMLAFIDPESDPYGKGYQILQSLIAVGSGGVNGLGFGQSKQKLLFLPEPQSDFIFSVIAEELGLTGATTLALVFGFFLWRGFRAGFRAPDRLGTMLAFGLTTSIVIQAFFNMSVALNLVPAKGITLPFISAGGSSLITVLAAVGILLNVSEQGVETGRQGDEATGRLGDGATGRRGDGATGRRREEEKMNSQNSNAEAGTEKSPRPPVPPSPSLPLSVIIAGGGTGGHIYPGIAIAQEFRRRDADTQILFVGTTKGLETKIIPREGFNLELIEVAALKRVGFMNRLKSLLMLPKSFLDVRSLIKRVRPDVVIGVGGYASGPVVLMAALMDTPTLVAEQNALPGFTNRVLARFVKAAAISFEEAREFFGEKAEVTGNPVRAEFFDVPVKQAGDVIHVLITGGSQGARAINEAVIGALPLLAEEKNLVSFTHQTGENDFYRVRDAYENSGLRAEVRPFIEKMVDEFAAADLVISRAGATTVAELAAAGKPAIMIPFPFAADDHQRKNAEAIERAGAGRMILQAELTPERLAKELLWLIHDPHMLGRMAESSKRLGHPDAAKRVVDLAMRIKG